ncbi:hypothetical protein [Natranaeroarchaeum sulfidigenes]|uniref:Putative membrane protein n=1 Tax=Natranaeroarchaeum sulfidigenes TaxID=2784880 RepID=A0A897MTF5_9EURY|nr:hypothetical protein [Natranaeroarchaeum sulfidigenes]QSG01505.1 putative membrane protein [Natranaeroarchaeum sulfidigenes]
MTEDLTASGRVETREQYSEWINRSVGAGVASVFVATAVWMVTAEPLVLYAGLGLYWLGCLGMAIGYWRSPVSIPDELERQIEREASTTTLLVVVVVTIVGLPAEVVLNATGIYTAPAALRGAIWGYMALILVYIAAQWFTERQYT